ncbi:DMT family transporter [Thalassotalea sp. G2M2-11]|uniref:DMT family transporter n=1 Tax=Thalassotalea sp. G2M2-11 TaxID=2787627 RepID=UPI0019D21D14|nr:DMT family transporter [Thalassotalea sp. G2M2-11]
MNLLSLLALAAGAAIAIQAAMNAKLGLLVKNALMGSSIAFFVACLCSLLAITLTSSQFPRSEDIRAVPLYLWFSGGALAAFGVGAFYFLIPKLGVGAMMSYALAGQIITANIISHFGWFNLPQKPIDIKLSFGTLLFVAGIILINGGLSSDNN